MNQKKLQKLRRKRIRQDKKKDKQIKKLERKLLKTTSNIKLQEPLHIKNRKQFDIDGLCIGCRKIRGKETTMRCDECDKLVNDIITYLINGKNGKRPQYSERI